MIHRDKHMLRTPHTEATPHKMFHKQANKSFAAEPHSSEHQAQGLSNI